MVVCQLAYVDDERLAQVLSWQLGEDNMAAVFVDTKEVRQAGGLTLSLARHAIAGRASVCLSAVLLLPHRCRRRPAPRLTPPSLPPSPLCVLPLLLLQEQSLAVRCGLFAYAGCLMGSFTVRGRRRSQQEMATGRLPLDLPVGGGGRPVAGLVGHAVNLLQLPTDKEHLR